MLWSTDFLFLKTIGRILLWKSKKGNLKRATEMFKWTIYFPKYIALKLWENQSQIKNLCSKFEREISNNEPSVRFCLGTAPKVSTRWNSFHILFQCGQFFWLQGVQMLIFYFSRTIYPFWIIWFHDLSMICVCVCSQKGTKTFCFILFVKKNNIE